MTYRALSDALRRTGIPFAEGAWRDTETLRGDYGVYALDGADTLAADDHHAETMMEGTVDLFARNDPGRDKAEAVQDAMEAAGVPWALNSIQYESGTGYTHWEWVFRALL